MPLGWGCGRADDLPRALSIPDSASVQNHSGVTPGNPHASTSSGFFHYYYDWWIIDSVVH